MSTAGVAGAVSLRNADFQFGPGAPLILKNFTLEVHPGEFFMLLGPSGCGKTMQLFKYTGDFRKNMIEHERRLTEWAVSMGLFAASDPQKLVQELIYPDIIKAAAPDR